MEENNTFPCFVADTSFIISYVLNGYFDNEFSDCIKDIEYVLLNNGQIYVPHLFWYEVENVLLYKTKETEEGQIPLSKSDVLDILYDLQQLPIYTDSLMDGQIRQRIYDLAEEYNLSYYDASYLELARRYSLPLKTYDTKLKAVLSQS